MRYLPCIITVVCIIVLVVGMGVIRKKIFYAPVPTGLDPLSAESAEFWNTDRDRARLRLKLLLGTAALFFVLQLGFYGYQRYEIVNRLSITPTISVESIVNATMTAIYAGTPTSIPPLPSATPTP